MVAAGSGIIGRSAVCLLMCCLLVAAGVIVTPCASAEAVKKVTTSELDVDPEFQPLSGVYYYDLFLNALRVGKATITVKKEGDLYGIQVKAKTRKAVQSLFKVRYKGEVRMQPQPIRPIAADIESQSGEKKKEVSIRFPETNRIAITETKSNQGKTTKSSEYVLESETFLLDPFSTIFLVRSLDWHVGMAEVFDIFTGKRQYELRLLCQSVANLKLGGVMRDVWVIQPEIVTLTHLRKTKLSNYSIYLSKDEQKDILMISGEPKLGRMVAKMRKFSKLPDN